MQFSFSEKTSIKRKNSGKESSIIIEYLSKYLLWYLFLLFIARSEHTIGFLNLFIKKINNIKACSVIRIEMYFLFFFIFYHTLLYQRYFNVNFKYKVYQIFFRIFKILFKFVLKSRTLLMDVYSIYLFISFKCLGFASLNEIKWLFFFYFTFWHYPPPP